MSFDEYIAEEWGKTFDGCDLGDTDPRQYSLGWYAEGVKLGITIGQKQGQESGDLKWRKELPATFSVGYRQGISYAAFQASHLSIDTADLLGLNTAEGANLMQQRIVALLEAAVKTEESRANAKVEPIL